VIVRRAGSSSTLRKTFLARHIDYAKRVLEKYTHNEPSVALKILNQEGYHRRRTRIEATIAMSTSWRHNHHRHRPFHDLGVALRSRDQTPAAVKLQEPSPATRLRGRPPKQRPNAGGRQTAEPPSTLPTRLPAQPAASPPAPRPKGPPSEAETQRRRPLNGRAIACASDMSAVTTHAAGLGAGATTEAPSAAT
jgi:hypothetical protein